MKDILKRELDGEAILPDDLEFHKIVEIRPDPWKN